MFSPQICGFFPVNSALGIFNWNFDAHQQAAMMVMLFCSHTSQNSRLSGKTAQAAQIKKSTICAIKTVCFGGIGWNRCFSGHREWPTFAPPLRLPAASPIIAATRWDACHPRQDSAMDIGCLFRISGNFLGSDGVRFNF